MMLITETNNYTFDEKKKELESFLDEILLHKYQYVRDGGFMIGGKCPDFVNRKKNKLIDLFGNGYHKDEDPQERIDHFRKYGLDTLVIWKHELEDLKKLKNKIIKYNNGSH